MDVEKKQITVKEINPIVKGEEVLGANIVDGNGNRFTIWAKKKDGQPTKAYSQWKEKGYGLDSVVNIAYKTEKQTYEKDGETKESTKRTIMWFEFETEKVPAVDLNADLKQMAKDSLAKDVDSADLESEIKVEDIPF